MPHRPPRKTKKPGGPANPTDRAAQLRDQHRREMAVRSTLARFQNRSSDRK